jgi:hypothetical protein
VLCGEILLENGIRFYEVSYGGFKVAFSSLDWIWDAYLQEKRQLRQPNPKF